MDIHRRQREWKRIVNEKNIEETMKSCIEAIFSDLRVTLQEFEQEYEYDLKNIQIDMEMNFSNITKDDIGKWIKWGSVAVGTVGAAAFVAANWWNPGGWVVGAGLVTTVASIGGSFAGDWKKVDDDKNYKKDIEKEKDSLKKQVKQKREITIKVYQDSFFKNIIEYENKVVSQMKIYIQGLSEIIQKLDDSCHEIAKLNKQMQEDFENLK